ncbi:Uncharacterized protein Fot_20111 [Forsythia ovata]|uniref:Secreted protein n=1 Tax=Forsythia ovata TaxID=205694 RepID=A0ABD1VMZ2_9LAMI
MMKHIFGRSTGLAARVALGSVAAWLLGARRNEQDVGIETCRVRECVATYLVPAVVTVHALQTSAARSDPLSMRANGQRATVESRCPRPPFFRLRSIRPKRPVLPWDRRLIECAVLKQTKCGR